MIRKSFMLIAGEPSWDMLAAELVPRICERIVGIESVPTEDFQPLRASLRPEFFCAGGPQMATAGVQLVCDMTQHAVVGFWEVIKRYGEFRRLFRQLVGLAIQRQPTVIICIDFSGFNLRFASAVRKHVRSLQGTFGNWSPRLVQYVSPQVWASRPERAQNLARDADLLLSILPFEQEWYARHAPRLPVRFVGHPILDRYAALGQRPGALAKGTAGTGSTAPCLVLLPGSRVGELRRHLPVLLEAWRRIRSARPNARGCLVLSNENLVQLAR